MVNIAGEHSFDMLADPGTITHAQMRRFQEILSEWGCLLSPTQLTQFAIYATVLQKENQRMNLTTITTPSAILTRHFLDSLACMRFWKAVPQTLVDVGSGAGFPGLPLKIAFPTIHLTMVESVRKKQQFLKDLVQLLELDDVTVVGARAEQVGQDVRHRERYDIAVARAVADLPVLVEYCLPLVRVGGSMLAPKGPKAPEEAHRARPAIEILGGRLSGVEQVTLPDDGEHSGRTMVILEKIAPTPSRFPRAVGKPARHPLS